MRTGRVVASVVGVLFASTSVGLLFGGGALLWANAAERDDDGFFSSPTIELSTDSYAVTSKELDFDVDVEGERWAPADQFGTVRLRVERDDGAEVFVGLASTPAVEAYLAGVAHARLDSVDGRAPEYTRMAGERTPAAPADAGFWVASASGAGPQALEWEVEDGEWTAVVMNADASRGVDVAADVGMKTGWVAVVGAVLVGVAVIVGALAAGLLVVALSGRRRGVEESPAHLAYDDRPVATPGPELYPARLSGHLDAELSRWLWLVKWFLAIPHVVVLALLWSAMTLLTFAAGAAILFTGRYPRGIFDFNVGVMRWTWRVAFYAFTLGTDRYPPFTLRREAAYAADFDVEYPAVLSRPLVLVKWLLALPHLLIISVFGGGLTFWTWRWATAEDGGAAMGGGLIGLLVLVSAVVLMFTGRYPQALFDFIMGMQRWTFRVLAYVGLMTDEYPPLRLDGGGADPGLLPDFPPAPDSGSVRVDRPTSGEE